MEAAPLGGRTLYRASTFMVKPSTPGMADMGCSSGMSEAKWASKGTSWKNFSHTSGCFRSCRDTGGV